MEHVEKWLPLALVALGGVATWGGYRSRFRAVERSQRSQGERIGALEKWQAKEEGRAEALAEVGHARRRPSMTIPARPELAADDDSGPEAA